MKNEQKELKMMLIKTKENITYIKSTHMEETKAKKKERKK